MYRSSSRDRYNADTTSVKSAQHISCTGHFGTFGTIPIPYSHIVESSLEGLAPDSTQATHTGPQTSSSGAQDIPRCWSRMSNGANSESKVASSSGYTPSGGESFLPAQTQAPASEIIRCTRNRCRADYSGGSHGQVAHGATGQ